MPTQSEHEGRAEGQASWASVIRRWADHDDDGLRRAAEQVAELVQQPGWEVLQKLINDAIATRFTSVQGERIKPHAEYVAIHSEIRGLKLALDAPGVLLAIHRDEANKRQQSVETTPPEGQDGRRSRRSWMNR